VIVALGAMRPDSWPLFLVGLGLAIAVATGLTIAIPRMYPPAPHGSRPRVT
jgi:hypothetical protein